MSEREEIIKTARQLDPRMLGCASSAGRYRGTDDLDLVAAIDIIAAHGHADEQTGDRKHGRHGARVGRYVLWSDPHKVLALQSFASEQAASRTFELGGLYLAGNTRRGSQGVRVGRYVLWGNTLQPYANQQSAAGALQFGLVPGAAKDTNGTPQPRAPRTWRNVTVIRRGRRAFWRRPISFQPRDKDPNLWCELHIGPVIFVWFRRGGSTGPCPQMIVAPAGSPAAVRAERRLRAKAASYPLWGTHDARRAAQEPKAPQSNGKSHPSGSSRAAAE